MWNRAAISKQRALTAGSPEAEPKRTKMRRLRVLYRDL